ncbi:MAG TPA: tetratricopeptide repeat protein [Chondromyces sp.]|nr:tetratricopeptide repeat protein [Chondromyces sp.]
MRKDSRLREEKGKLVSFIPTGEYYYSKGLKALHRKELNKAKKYLSRAMDLEPLEPMIACQLAVVDTELGNFQEANGLLHFILDDLDPHMNECHYFLANNYAHLGMFQQAFKHATEYLKKEEHGEFSEDAEDLLELITLDSEEAFDSLYEQDELISIQEEARYLLESGSFETAIERLEEIIEKHPDFWSAYNNLALAYFYLGEHEKAHSILGDVLDGNPGNLHALCNMAIFLYYEKRFSELKLTLDLLRKIRPMMLEHQYKLGATFALVGQFDDAYIWLKKLYKSGFEGEPGFYYWLACSAYYSGHEQTAKTAWRFVVEMNPEKEGLEPWNDGNGEKKSFEEHLPLLIKRLNSEIEEERLFGIFLLSVAEDRKAVISHPDFCEVDTLNCHEKIYLGEILGMKLDSQPNEKVMVRLGHETALTLYKHFNPTDSNEAGIFLLWFSIFSEMLYQGVNAKNAAALAGATEYIWYKLRNEKQSQKAVAEKYDVSISSLQKYIKHIREHLL